MPKGAINEQSNQEHISENIEAKRVGLYGYDLAAGEWRRVSLGADGSTTTGEKAQAEVVLLTDTYLYEAAAPTGSLQGDAVWQVSRTSLTSPFTTLWADGNSSYDNIVTSMDTLSYS